MRNKAKTKQRSVGKADTAIGRLLRIRRMELKISQAELGEKLGVSFQQIQKYERGVNRVSAARLEQIAIVLDCPVTWFFDLSETAGRLVPEMAAFMTSIDGMAIARAFMCLPEGKPRSTLRHLIENIAASHAAMAGKPRRLKAA